VNLITLTDAGTIIDDGVRANPAVIANDYIALDICEGLDGNILTDLCVGMNVC
jgi:hypothetical protein